MIENQNGFTMISVLEQHWRPNRYSWMVTTTRRGLDGFFFVHVTVHRNKLLFNKTNRRTNFPSLFLSRNSYVFRAVPLPIIRSFPLLSSTTILVVLGSVIKPAWHIPVPNVQRKTPDDWQRNCPKRVVSWQKQSWEIIASVGFIKKKKVQMDLSINFQYWSKY
jgi:hypothetical protein